MKNVAVLVASLGTNSINRKLAKALERIASERLSFTYVDLGSLPFYNDDHWSDLPASIGTLKAQVEAADAVLIVTPEYNRSFPGLLKNALDWGSLPVGKSSWNDKPVAVIGTSPSPIGTAASQAQLRSILPVIGFIQMGQPEFYLQDKPGLIDEAFAITDSGTATFAGQFMDKFVAFINKMAFN